MRRFWLCALIVLILVTAPALSVAQNLARNSGCPDTLDFAASKTSRWTPEITAGEKTDAPTLTVGKNGASLWARQDDESPGITELEKGEELTAIGYDVGTASWFMVRTQKGIAGWVRSSDVQGGDQLKKSPETAPTISDLY